MRHDWRVGVLAAVLGLVSPAAGLEDVAEGGLAGADAGFAPAAPDGRRSVLIRLAPSASLRGDRRAVADSLAADAGLDIEILRQFRYVPAVLVLAGETDIAALADDPRVDAIHAERVAFETLESAVPITQAPTMWTEGVEGQGRSIAVLDSGVDQSHPAFAGRIRDSACFGTPIAGFEDSFYSLCANGTTRDTESENAGDAALCEGFRQCEHGTLVSGAALGNSTSPLSQGVAREADLVVVQTKAGYTGDVCADGIRCRSGSISDLIAALEWLYDERDRLDLAAINMSVGFFRDDDGIGECDHPMEVIVRMLRDAGVAVTSANGNDGASTQGFPPCLPSTIDVGATDDFDRMATFSNNSSAVELLAPGVDLLLPVPTFYAESGYFTGAGTSAAAPMVAAAFTLLRQVQPRATTDQILTALQETGRQVFDVRLDHEGVPFNIERPRIKIADASTALETTFRFGPRLSAAVLPQMRSISPSPGADGVERDIGAGTATAFATLINSADYPARNCRITPPAFFTGQFSFTQTDPQTNAVVGAANTPVDIAAGGSASFVFAMTPDTAYSEMEMTLNFRCDGDFGAPSVAGVNRFVLSASGLGAPDLPAVAATLSGDGVVRGQVGGATAFAVSAVNIGADGALTVSVNDNGLTLPLSLEICPTNPSTGVCLEARAATTTQQLNNGDVGTYSVFVRADGDVAFLPARNRLRVEFRDAGGALRGSTSVAVRAD